MCSWQQLLLLGSGKEVHLAWARRVHTALRSVIGPLVVRGAGPGRWAVGGGSLGLPGSLFWLCVWGLPTQHMGLLGAHFLGNLSASGSALCAETCRDVLPGGGPKKLALGYLLLRGHLSISGLGGLQTMGVGPRTPSREWLVTVVEIEVSMEDMPQVFSTACWRWLVHWESQILRDGRDLSNWQVQFDNFVDEETEIHASHFALL